MLFKWITHKFCSSRLKSRSRAVRSAVRALEAERKEVDKRIRQEGKRLQHSLEDLATQRQVDLQEAVAFLNGHLASCQDMVQALQKYTEQAYATVDVWLQLQLQERTLDNITARIELHDEQRSFLSQAKEAYSVLYDEPRRQEWRTVQPKLAFATNRHIQACAGDLRIRRAAVLLRNREVKANLKRIASERAWVRTERQNALSDKKEAISKRKIQKTSHRQQRELMKKHWLEANNLWNELKRQVDARHPDGLYRLHERFLDARKHRELLYVEFQEAHEAFVLAKEAVRRVHQEEDFDNLQGVKDGRGLAFVKQQSAFEKLRDCRRRIDEIKSILEDKQFYKLRQSLEKLSPYMHREDIMRSLDGFLAQPERRRKAIGGPYFGPSESQSKIGGGHG